MIEELTLYVTSRCNLHCEQCVMGNFMRENLGYDMSMQELDDFLLVTKESGYRFDLIICGGEPLLWKHLQEGLAAIHQSEVANKILIFSNAINIKNVTDDVMKYVNQLRISRYESNDENTQELIRRYPGQIRVVERREFWHLPTQPIEGTLPQDCLTPERLYMKGKVFACPHSASVNGGKDELYGGQKLYVPLQKDYLNQMDKILEAQTNLCAMCISNTKVREHITRFKKNDNGELVFML